MVQAAFIARNRLTYVSTNTLTTAHPNNLLNDEQGLVWRSSGLAGAFIVFDTHAIPFDSIVLVGNNLRASDTIRIRMADTTAAVNGSAPYDETEVAWSGEAPLHYASSLFMLPDVVNYRYIRMDFTATAHPDGFIQAIALVVGKRITALGIDIGNQLTFEDGSTETTTAGHETFEEFGVRETNKIKLGYTKLSEFNRYWRRFMSNVGKTRAFFFTPNTEAEDFQLDAMFCRISSEATGTSIAGDAYAVELVLKSVISATHR